MKDDHLVEARQHSHADRQLFKDIEQINGLSVSVERSPHGEALFSNEHFAANGSFIVDKVRLCTRLRTCRKLMD